MSDAVPDAGPIRPSNSWQTLKEWPELILERLEGAGVARIVLNRPDKRNCWNAAALPRLLRVARHHPRRPRAQGRHHQGRRDRSIQLGPRPQLPARGLERPAARLGSAQRRPSRSRRRCGCFPRIMIAQVHGYCLGGALGIMNCHDLVYRGGRRAARHAGDSARQLRPAGHLDAAAWRAPGEEGRPYRAGGAQHLRHRGRRARHHQPGGAGGGAGEIHRAASRARSPRATWRRSSTTRSPCRWAAISRSSQAIQLDQLVGQRLRRAMDPTRRRRILSQIAKGRPQPGLQAARRVRQKPYLDRPAQPALLDGTVPAGEFAGPAGFRLAP